MMENLINEIISTNLSTRKNAVEQIINNKSIDLAPKLLKIAKEGPTYAKIDAIKAYGSIIDLEKVDTIYSFLKDKDWHIRVEAVNSIYNLLGRDALDIISPLLKDKAYGVRSIVEKIIEEINS